MIANKMVGQAFNRTFFSHFLCASAMESLVENRKECKNWYSTTRMMKDCKHHNVEDFYEKKIWMPVFF
jgi:hypothetical protein